MNISLQAPPVAALRLPPVPPAALSRDGVSSRSAGLWPTHPLFQLPLVKCSHMPGTMPSPLPAHFPLILPSALSGRCCFYAHFTDGDTEV